MALVGSCRILYALDSLILDQPQSYWSIRHVTLPCDDFGFKSESDDNIDLLLWTEKYLLKKKKAIQI